MEHLTDHVEHLTYRTAVKMARHTIQVRCRRLVAHHVEHLTDHAEHLMPQNHSSLHLAIHNGERHPYCLGKERRSFWEQHIILRMMSQNTQYTHIDTVQHQKCSLAKARAPFWEVPAEMNLPNATNQDLQSFKQSKNVYFEITINVENLL